MFPTLRVTFWIPCVFASDQSCGTASKPGIAGGTKGGKKGENKEQCDLD